MNRPYFPIYFRHAELLESLTDQQAGELFKALAVYAGSGEVPQFSDKIIEIVFTVLKIDIDESEDSYKKRCDKNSKNARKRWDAVDVEAASTPDVERVESRKTASVDVEAIAEPQIDEPVSQADECERIPEDTTECERIPNNANAYENIPTYTNECEEKPSHDLVGKKREEKRREEKKRKDNISQGGVGGENSPVERVRIDYQSILDDYNHTCTSLPKCQKLSEKRRRSISARLKNYTQADLHTAFEKAQASPFLRGESDRGWAANFDWIINETNMLKILEGNYDPKTGKTGKNPYYHPPEAYSPTGDLEDWEIEWKNQMESRVNAQSH